MTITVAAPNGSTIDFPDGTDHDTINKVMTQNFHPDNSPKPDKYQQAAIDEQAQLKAAGGDEGAGFTRRLAHGATMGADSTVLAALQTPLEMMKRGTLSPSEGYNYAKAREDQIMGDARKNTGVLGDAAEMAGGAVAGGGLAKGGVTATRFIAPEAGIIPRTLANTADAAGFGAVSGAMEGNGLQERAQNAAKGTVIGGVLGGGLTLAPWLAKSVGAPVIANIKARNNPIGYAESQVARAIHESGVSPDELSLRTVQAANEGQPQFTLADAMGNAGQRMLSTVARAPGEGRTAVVNALEDRQAGQGRRVANALAEGFDSPQTAAQTESRLTAARGAQADADYGAVRANAAKPLDRPNWLTQESLDRLPPEARTLVENATKRPGVDVTGTIEHLDRTLGPATDQMLANRGSAAPNDSIESVLQGYRNRLARVNPDDFASVERIRGDMADARDAAFRAGQGNRSRLLRGAVTRLDTAMENASSGYKAANANFSQASRDIDAVSQGTAASMRGRTEDTIPAFQALRPQAQQGFRSGYADPLIADAQKGAFGANKARPLTSDAFRDEAAAIAPGNDMMQRRIGRENTMFQTRQEAMGGSKTADNLADETAMGVDPHLIGQVLSGQWHGAVKTALAAGHNVVSGNTPQVRQHISDILLQNGVNVSPTVLRNMVDETVKRIQFVQGVARHVGRGGRAAIQGTTQVVNNKLTRAN